MYESIIDTDISKLIGVLQETHTQVIFRAYFMGFRRNLGQADYLALVQAVKQIKGNLPGIQIMGGISCSALIYPGESWPNGTQILDNDARQMLWILPNGSVGRHPSYPWPVIDITKPLARQFILGYAYKLIDAGVDLLFFDEVGIIPATAPLYGLKVSEEPYIASWGKIVQLVKEYARQKYGKDVLVTLNNGYVNAVGEPPSEVWPYQDFIAISINPKTVKTKSIQDDWQGFKTHLMTVYGHLPPIMAFMDWGAGDTPLSIFASLPRDGQIQVLKLLYQTSISEGLLFVYPLRGGALNGSITYVDYDNTYDAIKQGTFDTIVQLTSTPKTTEPQASFPLRYSYVAIFIASIAVACAVLEIKRKMKA